MTIFLLVYYVNNSNNTRKKPMATPESKVKDKVVKILEKHGVYYFFPATGGYGRSGVPDIICCYNSQFLAIECKSGDNSPTALQLRELKNILMAGGHTWVVNEENLEAFSHYFTPLEDDDRC